MNDYKQRMIDEYTQLKERTDKLGLMISNYHAGTLDFKPISPIKLLENQYYTMCGYLKILEQRAEIESIELRKSTFIKDYVL